MSNSRSIHPVSESNTSVPIQAILEVPVTSSIDLTNPAILKLVEQGGTIGSLVLVCLFVWLLTRLIETAKKD